MNKTPCDVSYDCYYTGFPEDTKGNCIFLIPEQFGGDETNRPDFCLIHGFDYPEDGCACRKTKVELIDLIGVTTTD